jgi:hypothetical protein
MLQRRVLVDRADAGIADVCQGICPFSRPTTILSALPFAFQGFRTFRARPFNVRLTDSCRSGRGHSLEDHDGAPAVADRR